MTRRDPASVVLLNAEAQAKEKERTATGERLLGRDAASLFAPDLSLVRGDPVQTAELLFAAGNRAREVLSTPSARAAFVSALILGCKLTDADLFPVFDGTKARVLYARAGAADRAYRLFSEILPDPRVGYADSNVEAAEGVEAGDADLLLLPFSDAAGNRVLSTQTVVETHGLLLTALARVRVGEGLLYGLYGRSVLPIAAGRATLRFSIPSPDAETLSGLYAFAAGNGLTPAGATLPPYGGRAYFALSGKKSDCLAAAVYSTAFCPGCELKGLTPAQPLSER